MIVIIHENNLMRITYLDFYGRVQWPALYDRNDALISCEPPTTEVAGIQNEIINSVLERCLYRRRNLPQLPWEFPTACDSAGT